MFWLILIIISLIAVIFATKKEGYGIEWILPLSWIIFAFSILITLVAIFEGSADYYWLKAQKAKATTYIKYLDDVKNIKGSDINIKKVDDEAFISFGKVDYIKKAVSEVANYNSYLEKCKHIKNSRSFWWFREGMFISKKVLDLEKI